MNARQINVESGSDHLVLLLVKKSEHGTVHEHPSKKKKKGTGEMTAMNGRRQFLLLFLCAQYHRPDRLCVDTEKLSNR